MGPEEPHSIYDDVLANIRRNVPFDELRNVVNTAAHVVSIGLDDLLLTTVVDARRAKDLRMIRTHRRIRLHRVVDAVNKRQVFRPNTDADDLRIALD